MAGPDSADPKQLLSDLRQIAAVCQRLGIDLGKVSAMGQSIGGKGSGQGPFETQNQGHAQYHDGGGTGYTNMASGAIVGSAMASRMSVAARIRRGDKRGQLSPPEQGIADKIAEDELAMSRALVARARASTPEEKAGHQKMIDAMNGLKSKGSFGLPPASVVGTKKASPQAMKAKKSMWDAFGDKYQRRMTRMATLLSGAFMAEDAFFGSVDPYSGESRERKIGGWATGTAQTAMFLYATTAAHAIGAGAMAGWGGAKVAGRGFMMRALGRTAAAARGARMAAGAAGGPWGIAAAVVVEAGIVAGDLAMANSSRTKRMRYELGAAKEGWSPSIKPSLDSKGDIRKPKVHSPETKKFLDVAVEGMRDYYIDERGQRKERSWIGKSFQTSMSWIGWKGETTDKEAEWRMKQAAKAHESAGKKVAVGDYLGAMEQINRAKDAVPTRELQPFLWKDPVRYLKQLESSRISSRNWARSQQPRGASRTGD